MATYDINSPLNNLPALEPVEADQAKAASHTCVYLLPGELKASKEPAQITTILGSCVASLSCWIQKKRRRTSSAL